MVECPAEFRSDRLGKVIANEKTGKVTIDTLSNYRTKLNLLKDQFKAAQTKVEYTKLEAYTYEDIVAAMDETENRKNDPNGSAAGNYHSSRMFLNESKLRSSRPSCYSLVITRSKLYPLGVQVAYGDSPRSTQVRLCGLCSSIDSLLSGCGLFDVRSFE